MKKYYWTLFKIVRHSWNAEGMSKGCNTFHAQHMIDTHPLQFQHDMNEKYGREFEDSPPSGHKARENYELINWKELTKEEYEQFLDLV